MRIFLAFTILLCGFGGLYLLTGPDFYWPARYAHGEGVILSGLATQLLGAALLTLAILGIMTIQQARKRRIADGRWQMQYFVLIVLALAFFGLAASMGEPVVTRS